MKSGALGCLSNKVVGRLLGRIDGSGSLGSFDGWALGATLPVGEPEGACDAVIVGPAEGVAELVGCKLGWMLGTTLGIFEGASDAVMVGAGDGGDSLGAGVAGIDVVGFVVGSKVGLTVLSVGLSEASIEGLTDGDGDGS